MRFYRSQRLVSFCIIWFFVVLSVESSFIPIKHVIAEYRPYLAVVGFAILLPYCLGLFLKDKRFNWAMAAVIILFANAAYLRNELWRDPVILWGDTVKKSPAKARAHVNLGYAYAVGSDYSQAIESFKCAIELEQGNYMALTNLGTVYRTVGDLSLSSEYFKKAITANPDCAFAYVGLGFNDYTVKDYEAAGKMYRQALDIDPHNEEARWLLKTMLEEIGGGDWI